MATKARLERGLEARSKSLRRATILPFSIGVALFLALVIAMALLNPRMLVQPKHEIGGRILTILGR
jgi:hypothetical protein